MGHIDLSGPNHKKMAHFWRNFENKPEGSGKYRERKFPVAVVNILLLVHRRERKSEKKMNVVHGLKRIPRIKFPQRHINPSASEGKSQVANEADTLFFSNLNNIQKTTGGKASSQPKRTPVSNEEMEAILLGGCI
jgi:hypothetical protein